MGVNKTLHQLFMDFKKTYESVRKEVLWKTKYILPSHRQNARQNHDINIANRCFENMTQLRYLGTTVTNLNLIQEKIKRRLNSVQNLLSSRLLSKNIKIRIYKTIILPVVLYGCETWSLTLRKEHRLRVFENRVLRRIFGPKRNEMTEGLRKLHNEELHNLYSSLNIISMINSRMMRWVGLVARMGRIVMYIGYWWESHKERDH
jgi:hypothetical protein